MSEHYVDGPTSEAWECVENPWAGRHEPIWWVRRAGWDERTGDRYEWRFGSSTDCGVMEPQELAARLNRLDAAERELTALREGLGLLDPHTPEELNAIAFGHRYNEAELLRQRDTAQSRNDSLEAALARLCEAVRADLAYDDYEATTGCVCAKCQVARAEQAAREVLR